MINLISYCLLSCVIAIAVPKNKLISIPIYKTPSKQSFASYIQPIDQDVAYEIIVKVEAQDSHVLHIANLPTESVDCNNDSVTIKLSSNSLLSNWPKMEQLILVLDASHNCPHSTPIYVSTEWVEKGSLMIFNTVLAKDAGVDGRINIMIRPSYYQDLYANQGYDGMDDYDDHDKIVNRTKIYPYRFNTNINRIFDIGSSGTFLNCDPCHIQGEIDLVMTAAGTISNDFQVASYIGGSITGSFKLGAGIQGKTSSGKTTLFRLELPEVNLPGILYLNPSFSVYGVTAVESDQDLNFNIGLLSQAKDFHVTLMSFGNYQQSSAILDNILNFDQKPFGTSSVTAQSILKGETDFGAVVSIRPELELGYKIMGYPKSKFYVAVDSAIKGSFQYMRPGDVCPNHVSGRLEARSAIMADVGFKQIMKETSSLKLMDGCLSRNL